MTANFHSEIIHYKGYEFQVVHYTGNLYRADNFASFYRVPVSGTGTPPRTNSFVLDPNNPTYASYTYSDRNIKYFTTREDIAKTQYVPQKAPYLYSWETRLDTHLILLDMIDTKTRDNLINLAENEHKKSAIRTAFPKLGNDVYRFSSRNTQSKNDISFRVICTLPVDGFYVPETNRNNYQFHPEIGLCSSAFHKIKLNKIEKFKIDMSSVGDSWQVGMQAQNLNSAAAPAAPAAALFQNTLHARSLKNKAARNEAKQAARVALFGKVKLGSLFSKIGSLNEENDAATALEFQYPPKIKRNNNVFHKLSGSKRKRNNNNIYKNENEGLGLPSRTKKRLTRKQRHI